MRRLLPSLVIGAFFLLGGVVAVTTLQSEEDDAPPRYVGQENCTNCHSQERGAFPGHAAFQATMHDKIHERPTPENVIIDRWFEQDTVLKYTEGLNRFDDDTLNIYLSKRGTTDEYWIKLEAMGLWNDTNDNNRLNPYSDTTEWMPIAYNYGGNGWLQRFLVDVDGSLYVAPFQYILDGYRDQTTDTGLVYFLDNNRWRRVNNGVSRIELFDFDSQEFLNQSWDRNCAACHVNGFDTGTVVRPDGLLRWQAKWYGRGVDSASQDINIAVGCESCHGPGEDHVEDPLNDTYRREMNPSLWDPTNTSRYWTDRKLDLCNQCHNRFKSTDRTWNYAYDEEAHMPYRPMLDLADFWNDPVKDGRYWDDKVTSRAHHQTGQDYWRSEHYKQHIFPGGCWDCHKSHELTEYPYQLDRNWYSMTAGEGCVEFGCHASKAATTMKDGKEFNVHAQHFNEHSQCVNCHYTKTATITFINHYEFSDHSAKVIRPNETLENAGFGTLGLMNTCAASCHRNGYGERNSPTAFDGNASIRFSSNVTPMKAPDYGIVDRTLALWNEQTDLDLADSLWEGYKRLWPQYVDTINRPDTVIPQPITPGIAAVSPNPAIGPVTIRFSTATQGVVRIEIFNTIGESVRVLTRRSVDAGTYGPTWDLLDGEGRRVPSGIYYIRATGGDWEETTGLFIAN